MGLWKPPNRTFGPRELGTAPALEVHVLSTTGLLRTYNHDVNKKSLLPASHCLPACYTAVAWTSPSPAWVPPHRQVRPGAVLDLNGKLLQVVRSTHVNAGRQLGNISMELRDMTTGAKHPAKFRPSEGVEVVRLESRRYTCLYREGGLLHVMDAATYEQMAVEASLFDPGSAYLVEGMEVSMAFHEGRPVVGERDARGTRATVGTCACGVSGHLDLPQPLLSDPSC